MYPCICSLSFKSNYNLVQLNFLSNKLYRKKKARTHTHKTFTGIFPVYINNVYSLLVIMCCKGNQPSCIF